ncbi:MAG: S-layer homology domain-containing protein, partial [Oscillospiraceae bacterium]|nr:S-layer homology domain-containing protein [Oscillospiraceae bacterium]
MKRLLSILLAAVTVAMTGGLSNASAFWIAEPQPVHVFTEAENAAIETDVFSKINQIEQTASRTMGGFQQMTEADYIRMVPQVVEAIQSSSTYQEGSLQQNGNFLVWQTKIGIPCCFDPRMEALRHNGKTQTAAEPASVLRREAAQGAPLFQDPVCGGWPDASEIGLIQPFWESDSNNEDAAFVGYSSSYKELWTQLNEATGAEGLRYSLRDATVNHIAETLERCAVVIFDSHGTTDYNGYNDFTSRANCSYLCLTTSEGITAQDTQPQNGPYGTYYHCLKGPGYAYVSGTCISNHMSKDAPHSLLYMGICLGMATDGMFKPLRERGVETVWGYSQSVTFNGEVAYMKSILGAVRDGEPFADAVAHAKELHGDWDPVYSYMSEAQARANHVAFPICVSSEDEYPGHGNVDAVQSVYSTWTLFSQFAIHALSNNEEWGTVSVSGNRIIATAREGYYAAGFEILDGTAQVLQAGNRFTVTAESNCTIQINFSPRPRSILHFSVPEGMRCEELSTYTGEELVLPSPVGSPRADAHCYRFIGWTTAPVDEDSRTRPVLLKPGSSLRLTEAETTLYALFRYFITEDGLEGERYTQVTQRPDSWEGRYVLAYQGEKALNADGSVVSNSVATNAAVVDLAKLGCVLDNGVLLNVPEELSFEIAATKDDSYTVKMFVKNYYLAMKSAADGMTTYTSSNTDKSRWSISMEGQNPVIRNVEFPAYSLQYNLQKGLFCCYSSEQTPITLYAAVKGSYWFTCSLKEQISCQHVFGDWQTENKPSCLSAGSEFRVCQLCAFKEKVVLDPLGHDYQEEIVAPSCTESGYVIYTCSRCADSYTEAGAAPRGHSYGQPLWSWNEELTAATARFSCECGDVQSLEAEISEEVIKEAAAHVVGEKKLTAKLTFEGKEYTDEKTAEIAALPCPCECFKDMPEYGTVEHAAIDWAYTQDPKVTNGTSSTKFSPNDTVTRGQAVRFLWNAVGQPKPASTENPFKDAVQGRYYYDAMLWAYHNDPQITNGTSKTKFEPESTLLRSQIITFLWRTVGCPEPSIENPYSDVPAGRFFEKPAIWAYETGIFKGENGKFEPDA